MGKLEKREANFRQEVVEFQKAKEVFDEAQKKFESIKSNFYVKAEAFFKTKEDNETYYFDDEEFEQTGRSYSVTRVQKVNLQFHVSKLKKALGKEFSERVIHKSYSIIDMPGLISYLKECGVDPQVFKSFLNVEEKVDQKELDKLEELGEISKDQIEGCYTVKLQNPYFTVRSRVKDDE